MARKEYLDYAGLKFYDEHIKKLIKSGNSDLETELRELISLIGIEDLKENETLLGRISAIEANIGDISLLGDNVRTLAAAIVGEVTRAQAIEVAIAERVAAIEDSYVTKADLESHKLEWETLGAE